MKIIEGFAAAKEALSRPSLFELGQSHLEPKIRSIIDEVRRRGDAALRDYTRQFDKIELDSLEVTKKEIASAYRQVDSALLAAMKLAAERIRSFHVAQRKCIWHRVSNTGSGQLIRPLTRVGIYVPGGTACYPSTVLMTAIPAAVAGVKEIIMVTPARERGVIPAAALVAADIAKVSRVFRVGGAQAIAALAFGTESIPEVDKICGPGNIFVTLAKKLVYGVVDIDGLAGPSEVLVIADETANAEYCAADLLAQAEHDRQASAILVSTSRKLAAQVNREVKQQLKSLSRWEIAQEALTARGMIAVVSSIDEAIELANLYAPEHLYLAISGATAYIDKITNAGCIVVGRNSTVVLGDYVAGPSHVLPTGGTARFSSPLNIMDFVKLTSVVNIDEVSLKELGPSAAIIASAEGFDAHARAVTKRLENLR